MYYKQIKNLIELKYGNVKIIFAKLIILCKLESTAIRRIMGAMVHSRWAKGTKPSCIFQTNSKDTCGVKLYKANVIAGLKIDYSPHRPTIDETKYRNKQARRRRL